MCVRRPEADAGLFISCFPPHFAHKHPINRALGPNLRQESLTELGAHQQD